MSDEQALPLPPPPRPAFGGGKLLDLGTGKVVHPSLGEVDPADFAVPAEEPLPPDAVRGTPPPPSADVPPFELPKDEDDPAGSVPAHHVEPRDPTTEDLRQQIGEHVAEEMENWERLRVEKATKFLADAAELGPTIAKTVKVIRDSFVVEGFSQQEALALTQMVVEKKFPPFL